MAKGIPSMVALLGLLAVAGYQNRDKLGSVLGNAGGTRNPDGSTSGGLGGALSGLGGMLGGSGGGGLGGMLGGSGGGGLGGLLGGAGAGGLGSVLSGGLGDLMKQFEGTDTSRKAQSWVSDGDNEDIGTDELERTLGEDTIGALQEQTGLSRQDLLDRLAKTLPQAVNRMTPQGRLPTEDEAKSFL